MDRYSKRNLSVIFITRTNGSRLYINPEHIQTVEATPDTVVTLLDSKKLIVRETPEEIADRFIEYRRKVMSPFISTQSGQ